MPDGPQKPQSAALAVYRQGSLYGRKARLLPRTVGHSKGRIVIDEELGFNLAPKRARKTGPRKAWT